MHVQIRFFAGNVSIFTLCDRRLHNSRYIQICYISRFAFKQSVRGSTSPTNTEILFSSCFHQSKVFVPASTRDELKYLESSAFVFPL